MCQYLGIVFGPFSQNYWMRTNLHVFWCIIRKSNYLGPLCHGCGILTDCHLGCALFYKRIWQLTVNERGRYADSEDTFLFKIEDSPDTRLGA